MRPPSVYAKLSVLADLHGTSVTCPRVTSRISGSPLSEGEDGVEPFGEVA
jgi:hypothetical protein